MIKRTETRVVELGLKDSGIYPSLPLKIGGGNPVVLQSMCNTKTEDIEGSLSQIRALKIAGFREDSRRIPPSYGCLYSL